MMLRGCQVNASISGYFVSPIASPDGFYYSSQLLSERSLARIDPTNAETDRHLQWSGICTIDYGRDLPDIITLAQLKIIGLQSQIDQSFGSFFLIGMDYQPRNRFLNPPMD